MKVAVCDDDRAIIEQIEEYIEIIHDKSLEYEVFFCAEELQRYVTEQDVNFDVFILDIEMKEMSGIDFAKRLREKNVNALIIFMTSYSQYVFDVFEMITFDMTLVEIWSQLDTETFGLLNKSLIVNISKIEGIMGESVVLQGGKRLYVSRDYKKELKKKHLDYLRGQV